jgi:ribosomal protein S18 acetylase RimI-like enzyme
LKLALDRHKTMSITIRELRQGETSIYRSLRLRALADSPDAFGSTYGVESQRTREEWEERIKASLSDTYIYNLVAEVEGHPAGMSVCVFDETDRSLCHLFAMWVAPEFRKRGVGRKLVGSAIEWMKSKGAKRAQLSVTEGNQAAFSLYTSFGFVDTGLREPLREGSPLQVIVMRRQLDFESHQARLLRLDKS